MKTYVRRSIHVHTQTHSVIKEALVALHPAAPNLVGMAGLRVKVRSQCKEGAERDQNTGSKDSTMDMYNEGHMYEVAYLRSEVNLPPFPRTPHTVTTSTTSWTHRETTPSSAMATWRASW
jgi:hypothetical protein